MNLFKSFTLLWWQMAILKLALLSFGIIIGSAWPDLFVGWWPALFLIFIVAGGYVTYAWWKQ